MYNILILIKLLMIIFKYARLLSIIFNYIQFITKYSQL